MMQFFKIDTKPLFVGCGSILSMDIFRVIFENQQVVNFWVQTSIGTLTIAYLLKQLISKRKD